MPLREREVYGFDHGILAGCMLREWEIPAPVPEAVAFHHHPARAHEIGGDVLDMVHLLRLAERLERAIRSTAVDFVAVMAIAREDSATFLGVGEEELVQLWPDLFAAIEASHSAVAGAEEEQVSGVHRTLRPLAPPPPRASSLPPARRPAPSGKLLAALAFALVATLVAVALGWPR